MAEDGVQLEADADEQHVLATMGALRGAGLTMRRIAEALNSDGFRKRRGTAWRLQYVATALASGHEATRVFAAA